MLPSDSLRKLILVAALLFLVGIPGSAIAEPPVDATPSWVDRVVRWLEELEPASLLHLGSEAGSDDVEKEPAPTLEERPLTAEPITGQSDVAPGFDPNG